MSPTPSLPPIRSRPCRPRLRHGAVTVLLLAAGAGGHGPAAAARMPAVTPATEPTLPIPRLEPGARVIVREIGRRLHPGVLEVHSDDIVVIRDPEGTVRSFPRSRVIEVIALLPPDSGRDMRLFLTDGTVREGRAVADGWDSVVLEIRGVRVHTLREDIASARILPTFEEELAHRRSLVEEADPAALVDLCRWLAARERWTLAAEETTRLLERHPRAREAARIQRVSLAQLELAASRATRAGTPADGAAGTSEPAPAMEDGPPADPATTERRGRPVAGDAFERSRLDADAVNVIRVYEIDFADPPRVSVARPVVDRIVREYADSPLLPADDRQRARLHQAEPIDLVRLIFELRARELYPSIQVLGDPEALRQFRRTVHDSWLINNCGACHGVPGVGGFRLHVTEPRSAETAMSNLLVLERLQLPDTGPLIDWEDPTNSRIIQYGLPRFRARHPHPPVEGFRAAFKDLDDRRVEQAVAWMLSMYQPRPTYPVAYDPAALIRESDLEALAGRATPEPAGVHDGAPADGSEGPDG